MALPRWIKAAAVEAGDELDGEDVARQPLIERKKQLLALALFGAAEAGPLEDPKAALQRQDYAAVVQIVRPLAKQGNAEAQTSLGWRYQMGQGVPHDFAQAAAWFRNASDQFYAEAPWSLAVLYQYGQGVPQDYAKALAWFRKAADQGCLRAVCSTFSPDL